MPLDTYVTDGSIREDLRDIIENIDPLETPVLSMAMRVRATNTLHEWLQDSLAAATLNAATEGLDAVDTHLGMPSRVNNRTQIVRKDFWVTDTMEAITHAAINSAFNYQMFEKAFPELARDTEVGLLQGVLDTSNPRQMDGLGTVITTNTVDATDLVLDEDDHYINLLETIWNRGQAPDTVLCGPRQKRHISAFVARVTRYVDVVDKRKVEVLDIYDSDFGTVRNFIERYMPSNATQQQVFAGQRSQLRTAWLQNTRAERQARRGDQTPGMVKHELTLEVGHQGAWGKIFDLKTDAPS